MTLFLGPGTPVLERLRLRREKGRRLLHKIGVSQLALGTVAIILGAVTLVYAAPNGTFIYFIGTPLWCGLFVSVIRAKGHLLSLSFFVPCATNNKCRLTVYRFMKCELQPGFYTRAPLSKGLVTKLIWHLMFSLSHTYRPMFLHPYAVADRRPVGQLCC